MVYHKTGGNMLIVQGLLFFAVMLAAFYAVWKIGTTRK